VRVTVVEFCGLPGSGKTTLAALTQAVLTERGVQAGIVDAGISADTAKPVRIARRTGTAFAEAVRQPGHTVRAARLIRATGQSSSRDMVAVLVQWLAIQRLLERARSARGVQLIEEGLVQTMWTLGLRAAADMAPPLWRCVPDSRRADLLVVVESPTKLLAERLAGRTSRHSRTQVLPTTAQLAELERGHALLERLVRGSRLAALRVHNDGVASLPELASQIAVGCQALASSGHDARSRCEG
jgi:hypothetical protein